MTAIELKQYIFEHKKIEYILEKLGCRNIVFHQDKNFVSSTQPDAGADNPMGVVIKNCPGLNYYSYSRGIHIEDGKDIFNLIETVKNIRFSEAIKYVHNLFGLKLGYNIKKKDKPKIDILDIFKRNSVRKKYICNVNDIKYLDENTLEDFYPGLHISWYKDNIMPWTAKKFHLCYSYSQQRQIIPIRYWLDGRLVGTNARTVKDDYELFNIKKYYISKGYNKSMNLYGFWENQKDIEEKDYCVLYEAERSVLKRDSMCDPTGLALQGHSISEEQIRIILSLDIHEVVVAMDKDVDVKEVWSICEKFYGKRKVSYIWDTEKLIGRKDSPADASNKTYQQLFKNRVVYDSIKHKQYLDYMRKK